MSKNTQNPYFPSAILTADRQEFDSSLMTIIEGEIPENLPGHLFILAAAGSANSPSVPNTEMIFPSGDGTSLISGDGMIFRLDFHKEGQTFQPGKVSLKTKLVGTPSFWADKAINEKPEYAQLKFYNFGLARISEWVGVRNVSNTSWLPMKFKDENARLLVTLDAGRSHEIDTESLDVVTPLGWNKEYAKQMELKLPFPLLMSSAHPYFDPRTNEVFTTNYSKSLIRMLLPSLQYDLEKIEESEIVQILEDLLKDLESLLTAIVSLIKKLIEWENKLPCFKKFFRIAISSMVIGDIKPIIKQLRVAPSIPKIKQLEQGLHQVLIDEIHDAKNLTDLKEELQDLIQLIRLALQVLMGSKDLENITYLVRWDGKGDLERWKLVNDDDTPVIIDQTMHQFGVTKDYVVLMDTSLKIGIAQLISLKNQKITNFLNTDPDRQYLLLIGAYRDNEVDAGHPFILALNEIQKVGTPISTITLQPLAINNVNQLIADTLNCDREKSLPLAELLFQKTNGNPFFLTQLLKSLYSEKLLTFNANFTVNNGVNQEVWQWNIEKIKGMEITDNVVDLMIAKIKNLASETQNVLKLAACIGNQFELDILAIVNQKSPIATAKELWEGLETGFIVPLNDAYKIPMLASRDEQATTEKLEFKIPYKFLHDRVQQAAYSLIPDDEKKAVQLQIGRLLLRNTPLQERAEKIFEIVNHLNLAAELITNFSEKIELAELNLEAGKKAKDATAYTSALQYLKVGMNPIDVNSWESQYELTLALHKELAEVEYLNGNFQESETLTDLIFERAKSNLEKAEVYNLLIVQYTLSDKYIEAIAAGSKALAILGIDLPETELPTAIGMEIGQVKENLGNKKISDLINEPTVTIPEKKGVMQLLMNLIPPAYFCNQPLMSFIAVKSVNLSLQYGLVPDLPYSYSIYGLILSCALGDYQGGYEFCQLAMKVSERFNNLAQKGKTCLVLGGNVHLWLKPIKSSFAIMDEGYKASLESGDLAFVGYIHQFKSVNLICQNSSLAYLVEELAKFLLISNKTKNQPSINTILGIKLVAENLLGLTESKLTFNIAEISEEKLINYCQETNSFYGLCTYYIFKSQALYLYGEYLEALRLLEESETQLPNIIGQFGVAEHNFYYSLTLAALYPTVTGETQEQYWQKLIANQNQMKIWADNCPENFLNRYLLVAAEMERLSGNDLVAMDLYDRAIFSAIENEFIQNEALANELAAKFWLHRRKQEFTELYLKKAYYGYQRWGAKYKVEDLENQYLQFRLKSSTIPSKTTKTTGNATVSTHTTGSHTSLLDLSTVVKASQALASELVLDQMLIKLIKIMIENAGAQVGYLIWESQKQWVIEAEGVIDSEEAIVLQSIPIETSDSVSSTIINYVARTQESVVLNDAKKEGKFTQDPYIQQHQPKSVLCFPLINQGKLISIIYLENNLTTGVFTPDRLEVLQVLSSQAAISIENARLYQNLEDKVTERTAQLAQANEEISTLNEMLKKDNLRMGAELDIVKRLQQMVLPRQSELEAIEGLEIAGFMEPADEVGGDYYDILKQGENVKISIGDVTGHGLESGVLMIMAQTAIRTLEKIKETDPVKFLDVVNQTLYDNLERMKSSKNMTLAILDYTSGIILILILKLLLKSLYPKA